MSKRQSKTGVQHLVYQAKTGFQYYLTFPKHFALNPQLPAQIRSRHHSQGHSDIAHGVLLPLHTSVMQLE